MSLIDAYTTACVLMEKERIPDGAGGTVTTWNEGAEFNAAITMDTTMQAQIAMQSGVTSVYTVTTSRRMKLGYHDVFKRISDGKIFRVTTDGGETMTPSVSSLDIAQVKAEGWELT